MAPNCGHDGDSDGLDANEFTDAGTFNTANELTQRSLTGGVTATYTRTYDAAGNLTNLSGGDGKDCKYEYDAFGRMVSVRNRSTDALVAEYTYSGLGFRTSWKYDANASGAVDGSDPVYWFTHDERWRIVATYRGSDTDPREVFVWHSAGMDGAGGSSYIDSIVLRQDDSTTAWTDAPDTLNRRVYPLQNWRADVVAVYDLNEGVIAERVKYSAYGVPFCVSAADFDADGDVDSNDNTAYSNANTAQDASADLNLDGVVDFNDTLAWNNLFNAGETGGRSVLSRSSVRNRIGYAGYQHDPSITGSGQASGQGRYHVRFRVYGAGVGRWTRRDPLGYVDGMSVYERSFTSLRHSLMRALHGSRLRSPETATHSITSSYPPLQFTTPRLAACAGIEVTSGVRVLAWCAGCTEWTPAGPSTTTNQCVDQGARDVCNCRISRCQDWTRSCPLIMIDGLGSWPSCNDWGTTCTHAHIHYNRTPSDPPCADIEWPPAFPPHWTPPRPPPVPDDMERRSRGLDHSFLPFNPMRLIFPRL